MNWHMITGEYPPQPGGVSDYTYHVAHTLADAGETVTVWCPSADGPTPGDGRVSVRRELGTFRRTDLRRVAAMLDAEPEPRRLLIQWVPHAFGLRALNFPFCLWVNRRAKRDRVDVLVHEAFVAFEGSVKQRVAAVIQQLMMRTLLSHASRVWVTIPTWAEIIRPFAPRRLPIEWLPVPSTIPVCHRPAETAAIRAARPAGTTQIIGHFGTYGPHVASELREWLEVLCESVPQAAILLLGRNADRFRTEFLRLHPDAADRIIAPGEQSVEALSAHIAACDLFVQPYSGGVSSRNTSLMACLAHGRPAIVTKGRLTEPLWEESGTVALVPEHDCEAFANAVARITSNPGILAQMSAAAASIYTSRFDVSYLIKRLVQAHPDADRSCALP
jgi:glycosyltransferase involved in cell wall biosynthesis